MRERFDLAPESVRAVLVRVDDALDGVCNIHSPQSGLQPKFSLRLTAAFALAGVDTASIESYSAENCADPALVALRDKVRVELAPGWSLSKCQVQVELQDSRKRSDSHDSGIPAVDLVAQRERLEAKFDSLVDRRMGTERVGRLASMVSGLATLTSLREFITTCEC